MMGEEDRNSENIRKESKELVNIRKEQQRIKLWGGALLGANLLLLAGSLWISERDWETKQPVPAKTDFQYPPSTPPAEEDTSIWVADKISDEASNVANTPATTRPAAAKTIKKVKQPRRKKPVAVIPASIITRPGMTLRSLARRYYGREVFWVYIYDRNIRVLSSLDTSPFDTLPSGIELELPRPADYGIDATEPISLQRACNQAKSLAKQ